MVLDRFSGPISSYHPPQGIVYGVDLKDLFFFSKMTGL